MKARLGFVSNSSSSSFVCLVCGEEQGGFDMSITEAGMQSCEHNHIICTDHALPYEMTWEIQRQRALDAWLVREGSKQHLRPAIEAADSEDRWRDLVEAQPEIEWLYETDPNELPPETCPICQFKTLDTADGLAYLLKEQGLTRERVLAAIHAQFDGDYERFRAWLQS